MIDIVSIILLLGCLVAAVKKGSKKTKWILLRLVLEVVLLSSQATDAEEFLVEEGAELRLRTLGQKLPAIEWVISEPLPVPPQVEKAVEEYVLDC